MADNPHFTAASGLDQSPVDQVDQTVAALEGGIGTLSPTAGLDFVRHWRVQLEGADDARLNDIGGMLAELEETLSRDALDGAAIGDLLYRLGESTTAAAQEAADARLTPALERLGTLLSRAGTTLGGGS